MRATRNHECQKCSDHLIRIHTITGCSEHSAGNFATLRRSLSVCTPIITLDFSFAHSLSDSFSKKFHAGSFRLELINVTISCS
jgi:hypothetical protein